MSYRLIVSRAVGRRTNEIGIVSPGLRFSAPGSATYSRMKAV